MSADRLGRAGIVLVLALAGCGGGDRFGPPPITAPTREKPELALLRTITHHVPGVARDRRGLVIAKAAGGEIRPLLGESAEGRVAPYASGRLPWSSPRLSWSPTGRKLALTVTLSFRGSTLDLGGLKTGIYSVRTDGSRLRPLTRDSVSTDPLWSPDGQTIVFARLSIDRESGRLPAVNLWAMDADGGDRRALTPQHRGTFDFPGSFSPDGSLVAFTRYHGGVKPKHADVYTIEPDGSGLTKVADRALDPAYSPDGERIAFASERDKNGRFGFGDVHFFTSELYVMDADGGDQERLTETRKDERLPSWSSDGARIAYQLGEVAPGVAEGAGVLAINPDGSCETALAADPRLRKWYEAPAWRPGSEPGPLEC